MKGKFPIRARLILIAAILAPTIAGAAVNSPSPHNPSQHASDEMSPPSLVKRDGHYALLVDGAPFLILGAQANNSSNYPVVLPKVWPVIEQLHANTLEIPIAWEQLEPAEGKFDFSYLDTLLAQAREHRVRLVLLWFATWKNNSPSYAPEWVKLDSRRFPRVRSADGREWNSLSPHYSSTLEADRKAFVQLLGYLKKADPQHTVILIQVENETGTYGAVRDHSDPAQRLFNSRVPTALSTALKRRSGTWREVFGKDADEFFHAWSIARFVEQVAAAGKAVNPLPMYVNAALRDPFEPQDPATYSSGGPTWNVLDIWKAAAPSIDIIAPDVYKSGYSFYTRTLEQYARPDNPLFVPETGNRAEFARYFFSVIGQGGIGFSPFGMDATGYFNYPLGAARLDPETLGAFAGNYQLAGAPMQELARLSLSGKLWGTAEPTATHEQTLALGPHWQAHVSYGRPQFGTDAPVGNAEPSGGVLIGELRPDEYLVTGFRARVNFAPSTQTSRPFMMARVEEGHYESGSWVIDRLWNGDQIDYGLNLTSACQLLHVKLAHY